MRKINAMACALTMWGGLAAPAWGASFVWTGSFAADQEIAIVPEFQGMRCTFDSHCSPDLPQGRYSLGVDLLLSVPGEAYGNYSIWRHSLYYSNGEFIFSYSDADNYRLEKMSTMRFKVRRQDWFSNAAYGGDINDQQYIVMFDNFWHASFYAQSPSAGSYALTMNFDPVPEPATWMTMLTGFAGLGLLARRKRRRASLESA